MTKRILSLCKAVLLVCFIFATTSAATLSPTLASKLGQSANSVNVGLVIVAFNTNNGLTAAHLNILRGVGITKGRTLQHLGMVAVTATAGQVRALAGNSSVRSIWSNERLHYFDNETSTLTGVDQVRTDPAFTRVNGGLPVSGKGPFAIVINDSGIDARHDDLKLGTHVIQNVQIVTDEQTNNAAVNLPQLDGFFSLQVVENVPDTDLNVGHGTHCAGIVGGSGQDSGGKYAGVAPGARLIGTGSGAVLFILNALGSFEWSMTNQTTLDQTGQPYNIRVISNSWGGSGAFDPNNPINIATKIAHDQFNIISVFAAGNSGPGKDTMNPYAKAPWVIGVAAGTKEGGLASFSSRGTSKSQRLGNSDPNDDYNAPSITAPGTGREFATNTKFSAAVISVRSATNVFANGLDADTEIPTAYVPYYTQISGTSMATPFIAGTIALMLDADPSLAPDEVKSILTQTASRMPGYDDFEVGSGYVNVYAAVDKVLNRSHRYASFLNHDFNAKFTVSGPAPDSVHIDYTPAATPGQSSTNAHSFFVQDGMSVLDIFATFDTALEDGEGNTIGLLATAPDGTTYGSGIALPVEDSPSREIVVKNPQTGNWFVEVRGVRGLTAAPNFSLPTSGAAAPGPVEMTITQELYTLDPVADIQGNPAQTEIEKVLKNRMMDTFPDGTFRPADNVTRGDLALLLYLNTPLRQSVGSAPKFNDLTANTNPGLGIGDQPLSEAIAEAVTSRGSSLRDWYTAENSLVPAGMMSANGSTFNPAGVTSRLDLAIALVRALGNDADAKTKTGTSATVTYSGQVLTVDDNADIPAALRGYVQLALDKGILQAQFSLTQGPYDQFPVLHAVVKPNDPNTRAATAFALDNFRQHFVAGN
jgi:serine protease AprX